MSEEKMELDHRDYLELEYSLDAVSENIYKDYYAELEKYAVLLPCQEVKENGVKKSVKFYRLDILEKEKNIDVKDKLTTIFQTATALNNSLILMIKSNNQGKIDFYIGIKDRSGKCVDDSAILLKNSITTQFPGTALSAKNTEDIVTLVDEVFLKNSKRKCTISSVSGMSVGVTDKADLDSRSIDKFLKTMQGKVYTALFIIDPIRKEECTEIRKGYEQLYSSISPFEKSVWNYNSSDSVANVKSITNGLAKTVTKSIGKTKGYSVSHMDSRFSSKTKGWNFELGGSEGTGHQESVAKMDGKSSSVNIPIGAIIKGVSVIGGAIAVVATGGAAGPAVTAINAGVSASGIDKISINKGKSNSITNTVSDSISKSLTGSVGWSFSTTEGASESDGYTVSDGINEVLSEGSTESSQETTGEQITEMAGKSIQIEYVNKEISNLLLTIEHQINRLNESEDYGVFNVGAYFISPYKTNSILAANVYKNIKQGKGSSNQTIAINTWSEHDREDDTKAIVEYLSCFQQPVFLKLLSVENDEAKVQMMPYSAGSLMSGAELPVFVDFPSKSIYGVVVDEHVEFGHNQKKFENALKIGSIVGGNGIRRPLYLDYDMLTSHVFVTGSTGSGKSNAIYRILEESHSRKLNYLVIEPAKGEYKNILSQFSDSKIEIYGADPKKQKALKINPFAFDSKTININVHIEGLLTIFQVCWPLYAAMPSILRQAFEKAYILCGWNLRTSENLYGDIFPSFEDIKYAVKDIVNSSDYSDENKGNYKGALCTRIDEMCTGLYRNIFVNTKSDIMDELLDNDILIDLSDVSMPEHKSLIMGLLVLKLQEAHKRERLLGSKLNHITVLEEAHHLLRKDNCSVGDGNNIGQRSVEMLTNAIAEMRSSGEAFIIVDQAPDLLDEAIIRNTNTKILFNTSFVKDQDIVGKSIDLSQEQIGELSVLPVGRAIVYQRGWQEVLLCDFDEHEYSKYKRYNYVCSDDSLNNCDVEFFNKLFNDKVIIKEFLMESSFSGCSKLQLLTMDYSVNESLYNLYKIISEKVINDIGNEIFLPFNNLNKFRSGLKSEIERRYMGLTEESIRCLEMILMYSKRNVESINKHFIEYVNDVRR